MYQTQVRASRADCPMNGPSRGLYRPLRQFLVSLLDLVLSTVL